MTDTGWAKAAWGGLFGQFHERATIVQVALGKPDADTILSIIARAKITSFCAPPTLYRLLVQADFSGHDLSALRHCTSAGEPLNPEVIRAWKEGTGGLTVYDGYGQSETCVLVANYRSMPVRPGLDGQARSRAGTSRCSMRSGERAPDDDGRQRSPFASPIRGRSACSTATTATPTPTPSRFGTAGTTPATRPGVTATATSGSRAATTT